MFWYGVATSISIRLILVAMDVPQALKRRVEIATPVNSHLRLEEGKWLMESGVSPYAGSAYHGSPLLLRLIGPFSGSSIPFIISDVLCAFLFRSIGGLMFSGIFSSSTYSVVDTFQNSKKVATEKKDFRHLGHFLGELSGMFYLLNPVSIVVNLGLSTSTFENLAILATLNAALSGNVPLTSFFWLISTHLSMYPLILLPPILLLLLFGPDRPPPYRNSFSGNLPKKGEEGEEDREGREKREEKIEEKREERVEERREEEEKGGGGENLPTEKTDFGETSRPEKGEETKKNSELKKREEEGERGEGNPMLEVNRSQLKPWLPKLGFFIYWVFVWGVLILGVCSISLRNHGGLQQMFPEMYGFLLRVEDQSPNLGVCWYFFTELFSFFRPFFLFVFPSILFVLLLPLSLRFPHRPLFLTFVFLSVTSLLKPYPSLADPSLYLSFLPLFTKELKDFRYFFVLFFGFLYVVIMGPIMFDLWIWRGTGNANFYFAVGLVYACVQAMFVVECVRCVLKFDRNLKKKNY